MATNKRDRCLYVTLCLLSFSTLSAYADEFKYFYSPQKHSITTLLRDIRDDSIYIITSPARINKQGLILSSLAIGTTASLFLYDTEIRDAISPKSNSTLLSVFEDISLLGNGYYDIGIIGGIWLSGRLTNNNRLVNTSYNGLEGFIISGIFSTTLKISIGRKRPDDNNSNKAIFNSFTLEDSQNYSFPSGHTINAFALAATVASEYNNIYMDILCYGLASAVGFSRIYQDVHWASDVFFGAVSGIAIGKTIHYLHTRHNKARLTLIKRPYNHYTIPILGISFLF